MGSPQVLCHWRPITLGYYVFLSYTLVSAIGRKGSLDIQVTPPVAYRGSRMELTCFNRISRAFLPGKVRCDLWWSANAVGYAGKAPSGKTKEIRLKNNSGWPLRSSLILLSMDRDLDGLYSCVLTCGNMQLRRSVSISTQEDNDRQASSSPGNIGLMIGLALIMCLTVLGIALYVRDAARASRARLGRGLSRISRTADDSESNSRRWSSNPAPRYSLVMESGDLYPPPERDQSDVFMLLVSPPCYTDALRSLKNKGLVFNFDRLQPMPPCYVEAVSTSHSSAGSDMPRRHSIACVHGATRL